MEQITINLAGSLRRETFQGREHIVVPMTLIVPGVLNGSRGPILYSAEELSKDPTIWNGVPLVLGHPKLNGTDISARDPDVLNTQSMGLVLKSRFSDNKLQAEAWFDIELTNKIDSSIIKNLEAGTPLELSTGLSMDFVAAKEEDPFDRIATNFRPDHLAVLVDQVGACSIDDGCGVLVNEDTKLSLEKEANMAFTEKQKAEAVDSIVANCGCWSEEDKEVLNAFADEKLEGLRDHVINTKQESEALQLVANAATKSFEDSQGNTHTFSSEKSEWVSEIKKAPEKKEETVVNETKPQTTEEWLNKAPEEVRNTLKYAQEIETREKAHIIERLIVNVDAEGKKKLIASLSTKSLEELNDLSLLAPKQEESNPVANYFGSQGVSVENAEEFSDEDILPIPGFAKAE